MELIVLSAESSRPSGWKLDSDLVCPRDLVMAGIKFMTAHCLQEVGFVYDTIPFRIVTINDYIDNVLYRSGEITGNEPQLTIEAMMADAINATSLEAYKAKETH